MSTRWRLSTGNLGDPPSARGPMTALKQSEGWLGKEQPTLVQPAGAPWNNPITVPASQKTNNSQLQPSLLPFGQSCLCFSQWTLLLLLFLLLFLKGCYLSCPGKPLKGKVYKPTNLILKYFLASLLESGSCELQTLALYPRWSNTFQVFC